VPVFIIFPSKTVVKIATLAPQHWEFGSRTGSNELLKPILLLVDSIDGEIDVSVFTGKFLRRFSNEC
jgi:hypothetical protein